MNKLIILLNLCCAIVAANGEWESITLPTTTASVFEFKGSDFSRDKALGKCKSENSKLTTNKSAIYKQTADVFFNLRRCDDFVLVTEKKGTKGICVVLLRTKGVDTCGGYSYVEKQLPCNAIKYSYETRTIAIICEKNE